jgi:hypothetical protein
MTAQGASGALFSLMRIAAGYRHDMAKHDRKLDSETDVHDMSDEEVVEEFRKVKGELTSDDESAVEIDSEYGRVVEEEMDERGLLPDREDVIPDDESEEMDEEEAPRPHR